MTTIAKEKVAEVIALAERAVAEMKEASEGKPPETVTETNAQTFANLAGIMESLVGVERKDQVAREKMTSALDRIANLKVRSATELLEQKNWERLLAEVQAIAQDALTR